MKIQPTDEIMNVLQEIAVLKNMNVSQVSENVLELYSNKYLKMVKDAQIAAKNVKKHYD